MSDSIEPLSGAKPALASCGAALSPVSAPRSAFVPSGSHFRWIEDLELKKSWVKALKMNAKGKTFGRILSIAKVLALSADEVQAKGKELLYVYHEAFERFSREQIDVLPPKTLLGLSRTQLGALLENPALTQAHIADLGRLYIEAGDSARLGFLAFRLKFELDAREDGLDRIRALLSSLNVAELTTAFSTLEKLGEDRFQKTEEILFGGVLMHAVSTAASISKPKSLVAELSGIVRDRAVAALDSKGCWVSLVVRQTPDVLLEGLGKSNIGRQQLAYALQQLKGCDSEQREKVLLEPEMQALFLRAPKQYAELIAEQFKAWSPALTWHLSEFRELMQQLKEIESQKFWSRFGKSLVQCLDQRRRAFMLTELVEALAPQQLGSLLSKMPVSDFEQLLASLKLSHGYPDHSHYLTPLREARNAYVAYALRGVDDHEGRRVGADALAEIRALSRQMEELESDSRSARYELEWWEGSACYQRWEEINSDYVKTADCLLNGWRSRYPYGYGRDHDAPDLIRIGWRGQMKLFEGMATALEENLSGAEPATMIANLEADLDELEYLNDIYIYASGKREYPKPVLTREALEEMKACSSSEDLAHLLRSLSEKTRKKCEALKVTCTFLIEHSSQFYGEVEESMLPESLRDKDTHLTLHFREMDAGLDSLEEKLGAGKASREDRDHLVQVLRELDQSLRVWGQWSDLAKERLSFAAIDDDCVGDAAADLIKAVALGDFRDGKVERAARIAPHMSREAETIRKLGIHYKRIQSLRERLVGAPGAADRGNRDEWGLLKRLDAVLGEVETDDDDGDQDPAVLVAERLSGQFMIQGVADLKALNVKRLNSWSDVMRLCADEQPLTQADLDKCWTDSAGQLESELGHPARAQALLALLLQQRHGTP